MKNLIKRVYFKFIEFLFPKYITCCFCNEELQEKGLICEKCLKRLPFIKSGCKKCGCEVVSGDYCVRCKNVKFYFDGALSVCDYDNFVKNIIYKYKNGDKYLYEPISFLIEQKIRSGGKDIDLLAFVPITARVLKKRGYNQSALIADYLSKQLNLPCHKAFIKVKESSFQKNITAANRQKNVKGVFLLKEKDKVKGKNVLIIDDIITTGSTLSECAKVFKSGGAKNVWCCTFSAVKAEIAFDKSY
ncbi:MAG: ComF family protein [Clostridia bacterium]|nr:ComF family protein [Clostridia bacterium]